MSNRMTPIARYLLFLLLFSGCGSDSLLNWYLIKRNVEDVHTGMSEEEVIHLLGQPPYDSGLRDDGKRILSFSRDHLTGFGYDCVEVWFHEGVVEATREYSE